MAVPGLSVASFVRAVLEAQRGEKVPVRQFREEYQFFQCRQPSSYRAVVKRY